mmetsp:Transcript_8715/g.11972  ORF Transcript_8715/g.11972 Transcript_8715/m.11972 type:complete len:93 (-) Transcript_8715:259-537(-)
MTNKIVDIPNDQISKLDFKETIGRPPEVQQTIRQQLKSTMVRPLRRRQDLKIVFETKRGFFQVKTKLLSLGKGFTTINGGHRIPIESIVKVV